MCGQKVHISLERQRVCAQMSLTIRRQFTDMAFTRPLGSCIWTTRLSVPDKSCDICRWYCLRLQQHSLMRMPHDTHLLMQMPVCSGGGIGILSWVNVMDGRGHADD